MKFPRWRLSRKISSRTLLAGGLTSIVICALFIADMAGVVPDRAAAQREGRVALAESVALTTALLAARGDTESLERYLATVTARNAQMNGVRLRSADGGFVAEAGTLEGSAQDLATDTRSTDTRVIVPVLGGQGTWGHVELQYKPLSLLAEWAPWLPPVAPLAFTLAMLCTGVFHLYLQRMLRHLDPSNAIPARVRNAFDTLAEGLLVLDPQGNIVMANKAFAQGVGADPDALIGRSAASLPWQRRPDPARPQAALSLPWREAQADGQLRYGQALMLKGADGKLRTFMVNSSPIPGGGKSPAGVLVSFDDVTELEEKEVQLRVARDEAQEANRAKSDFLANMSHEIRTPMNAILGFTELLRRQGGTGAAEAQKYLSIIHGSGKHLLSLINDILDLSKVEAGRLEVERLPCAVHTVVLDVVRIMSVKAAEKGIRLDVRFDGALPAQISTDAARLRQVFTNLVGNAIKFTSQGAVTVHLAMGRPRDGQGADVLRVDVADSGIGIPAERLESIFEPFVQAEASTTRQFGGTGLGLTISRRFARALGGDVWATSRPGHGSTFHVSLDTGDLGGVEWLSVAQLQAQAEAEPGAAEATAVTWRFPARKVLVVDDGAENRELVRLVLQETGLRVVEAHNGAQALAMVKMEQPDLVLMDIQMPVMDGNTATRKLREAGHTVPVYALTANAMKGFEKGLQDHGFSGYLTKPIDIDLLLATLAPLLGGQQETAARAEPAATAGRALPASAMGVAAATPAAATALPAPAADPAPSTDPDAHSPIVSRLAQHPRLARVAASFCAQLPTKLAEMQACLDAGDAAGLAALAHWLKGAGGTVGYDAYFQPARSLETAARQGDLPAARSWMAVLQDMAARTEPPRLPGTGAPAIGQPGSLPAATPTAAAALPV